MDIISILLNSKADVNIPDEKGESPIFVSCYTGREDVAMLLLESKADLNIQNKESQSPLELAALLYQGPLVELFLNHGAEVTFDMSAL
uniref:Uncharacterized protein n=1 Tax=Arcella intermedia TaxID=1963864 RepID=A0A6B2LR46_9EUKA